MQAVAYYSEFHVPGPLQRENRMHAIQSKKGAFQQTGYRQTGAFDKYIPCHSCDNGDIMLVIFQG